MSKGATSTWVNRLQENLTIYRSNHAEQFKSPCQNSAKPSGL